MNAIYQHKISLFRNKLENVNTAVRIVFVYRKSLEINFTYQENLKWYDDVLPFLQILKYLLY